nr:MAG: hypothetical protein [Bacteriophage sp.]
MAYNSQYTGAQIDEAIGDVRGNKAAWSGKQDVLLDSGAKVGDLIKVKAVDASGKPTAWVVAVAGKDYLKTAPVTSVNGKTGAVTLGKSDVGLGSVDNVSVNARMNRTTNVNAADANYTSYMARGEALFAAETTPIVNGQIAWQYE